MGWGDSSRKTSGGGVGVTLPFLVWSIPWENGKLSTLAYRLESIWEEGSETGRTLLSTCPLLPQDQKNNRKNRTSAWRAPRTRREEGAKTAAGPRGGWSSTEVSRRGREETAARTKVLVLEPSPGSRSPRWTVGAPRRLSWNSQPGRPKGRGPRPREPRVSLCLSAKWGAAPSAAQDGSPVAKYRLSTPVLASSAPSASVAKFLCSRKRSKRWRRPSMALGCPGLAA